MLGLDLAGYRAAYTRPHRAVFRAEVWNHDEQIGEVGEIIGGDVKCTLTSQVTRRGSLTVPASMMPTDESGLLAPFGNRLKLYRGIAFGGAEFVFPVFTGLITRVSRQPRQPCVVDFSDRGVEVEENDFEAAEESISNNTIVEEIVRLIREGVPRAEFGVHDTLGVKAGPQVWEDSRSQACDQLADAGGAFWYALADGRYVIRRVPWAYQPDGVDVDPVVTYTETYTDEYQQSIGTLQDYGLGMSRENVFNVVVGVSDQPTGRDPIRATVRDTNAASPTYVGGKFGRRVLKVELPAAGGGAAVQHGAQTMLRRSRSAGEAMPFEITPDPALELGDLAQFVIGRRGMYRVVSEFNVPMTEGGVMSGIARPIVLPDGTVVPDTIY